MPYAPAKPCRSPACAGLAVCGSAWCAAHRPAGAAVLAATRAALDTRRGSAASRGYDAKWSALSRTIRARHPLSLGYLTRAPAWDAYAARAFHALREHAAASGAWLRFLRPGGPGLLFLAAHPIYVFHASAAPEPSEVTDHILPHRGEPALFNAEWNLQALSKRQHDTKTAREDGGFRGAPPPEGARP